MTAEGIAMRYPEIWGTVLDTDVVVRFSRLGPGPDQCRRPDCATLDRHSLTASPRMKRMGSTHVKYVYYSILGIYAVWGTAGVVEIFRHCRSLRSARCWERGAWILRASSIVFQPRAIAQGVAAAIVTANRRGAGGIFFIGISLVVLLTL